MPAAAAAAAAATASAAASAAAAAAVTAAAPDPAAASAAACSRAHSQVCTQTLHPRWDEAFAFLVPGDGAGRPRDSIL